MRLLLLGGVLLLDLVGCGQPTGQAHSNAIVVPSQHVAVQLPGAQTSGQVAVKRVLLGR